MRLFSQRGAQIRNLSVEARLVYSVFALFSLAALAVTALLYEDMLGLPGGERAAAYYGGAPAEAAPTEALEPSGPVIDLPDVLPDVPAQAAAPASGASLVAQVSARKLLEVTHFHLFTAPIFFLVVAHLFLLCGASRPIKLGVIAVSAASLGVHLAAPAIIRAAGGAVAWLMPATGLLMGATLTMMTVWPLAAMWAPRRAPRPGAS
jgi:hypothetical protein